MRIYRTTPDFNTYHLTTTMKAFIITLLCMLGCLRPASAQSKQDVSDTLLYRQMFNSPLGPVTDMLTLMDFYAIGSGKYDRPNPNYRPPVIVDGYSRDLSGQSNSIASYIDRSPHGQSSYNVRGYYQSNHSMYLRPSTERFVKYLLEDYETLHSAWRNIDQQRQQLISRLEAFDTLAQTKPLFYSEIHSKKYKGDIPKYVHDLYRKSIMGNPKKLKRFILNQKVKRLRGDMGFQYTLGLALYEMWIRQLREGKTGTKLQPDKAPQK